MKITEGKAVISDVGYAAIADTARGMTGNSATFDASVFSWCWLVLQWNLVSRSVSVQDIMLEHLDWHGDALKVRKFR